MIGTTLLSPPGQARAWGIYTKTKSNTHTKVFFSARSAIPNPAWLVCVVVLFLFFFVEHPHDCYSIGAGGRLKRTHQYVTPVRPGSTRPGSTACTAPPLATDSPCRGTLEISPENWLRGTKGRGGGGVKGGIEGEVHPFTCSNVQHRNTHYIYLSKSIPSNFFLCTKLTRCLLYTSPSPRDQRGSRMPSSA